MKIVLSCALLMLPGKAGGWECLWCLTCPLLFPFFWAVPFSRLSFGSPAPGAELAVKMTPEFLRSWDVPVLTVLLAEQAQILLFLGEFTNRGTAGNVLRGFFGIQGVKHRSLRGVWALGCWVNQHQRLRNSLGRQILEQGWSWCLFKCLAGCWSDFMGSCPTAAPRAPSQQGIFWQWPHFPGWTLKRGTVGTHPCPR